MASTFANLTKGMLYGVRLPIQFGATAVYQDVRNDERFPELVEQHKITYTSAATPFLHDTLNAPDIDDQDGMLQVGEPFLFVGYTNRPEIPGPPLDRADQLRRRGRNR